MCQIRQGIMILGHGSQKGELLEKVANHDLITTR
jgi:hypothetical protein